MVERLEDLDENTGTFVKALMCTKCGESLTNATDYVRAQHEFNNKNILKNRKKALKALY